MNFKLNRQQVLHIALLITIILVAIYLLKPTLEGKGGEKCPCPTICPCHPKDDKGIEGTWIGSINSGRDKKGGQLEVEIKKWDHRTYDMILKSDANLTKPSPNGHNWKKGKITVIGDNLYQIKYKFDGHPEDGESIHTAKVINGNELVLCNTNGCVLKEDKSCAYPCTVTASYTRKGTNSQYDSYINTNHCPLSCIHH